MEELSEYIIEKTKGFFGESELNRFFTATEREAEKHGFTRSSYANFERIVKSIFDLRAFVSDALKYPHYVEIIAVVAHNSNFLTDILVRNPGLIYKILTPSFLLPELSEEKLENEAREKTKRAKNFDSRVRRLRKLKNEAILVIAVRDLLGLSPLRKVIEELSALARVVARRLFAVSLREVLALRNIENFDAEYVIASLGKLGGNELNYSSDIDLLFFYGKEKKFGGVTSFEILSDAISLFAEKASEATADGFLYRVDFRLRPDGKFSPLVKTYKDYIYYYETRGENWERQMLLKLAFLGGSKKLYDKFVSYLSPFVFPSEIPPRHFESVRKMKAEIEKSAGENYDIKKMAGGIRDAEFSAQVLQTLNGKRFPELREPNTLKAIEKLAKRNLLTEKESRTLAENYTLYRKAEHYLQLVNDAQTHVIPRSGETLEKLARNLGFENGKALFREFDARRAETRKIFDSVTGVKNVPTKTDVTPGFIDEKKARRNLRLVLYGENLSGGKTYDKITLERAEKLEPALMKNIAELRFPDVALENFAKIVSITKTPSVLLGELLDEEFLKVFLSLCETSEKFVSLSLQHPEFIDDFVSRDAFAADLSPVASVPKLIFRLNAQFAAGLLSAEDAGKFLSERISETTAQTARKRFGNSVFVAALGSLALGSMNFNSDVDLIIIAAEGRAGSQTQKKAEEFLAEINSALAPFTADLRLRPEGESAQLIWDIAAVEKYFEKRVSAWELIAFAKARFLAGDEKTFERFKKIHARKIFSADKTATLKELRSVYGAVIANKTKFAKTFNLKYSHGGLTTLDFAALPKLLFGKDDDSVGEIPYGEPERLYGKELFEIRRNYLNFLLALQSVFDTGKYTLPADAESEKRFERALEKLNLMKDYRILEELKKRTIRKFGETYEKIS